MSFLPVGLTLVAGAILLFGFRFSGKAGRPKLLRAGAVMTAAGVMLLWVLPFWLFRDLGGEWALPIFIGTLFVAVSALGLGIQLIARACGALEPSRSDRPLDDFITHNDLP